MKVSVQWKQFLIFTEGKNILEHSEDICETCKESVSQSGILRFKTESKSEQKPTSKCPTNEKLLEKSNKISTESRELVKNLDSSLKISSFVQKILYEDSRAGESVLDLFVAIKDTKKNLEYLSSQNQKFTKKIADLLQQTAFMKKDYSGLSNHIRAFTRKINAEAIVWDSINGDEEQLATPKYQKKKAVTPKKNFFHLPVGEKKANGKISATQTAAVDTSKPAYTDTGTKDFAVFQSDKYLGKGEPECPIGKKIIVTDFKEGDKKDVKFFPGCNNFHLKSDKDCLEKTKTVEECLDVLAEKKVNPSISVTAKEVVDILLMKVSGEVSSRPRSEIVGYFHNQMNFAKGEANINLSESMTQTNCDFCETLSDQGSLTDDPSDEEKSDKIEDKPLEQNEDLPIFEGHKIICWTCGENPSKEMIETYEDCQEFPEEMERENEVEETNNSSEEESTFEEALTDVAQANTNPGEGTKTVVSGPRRNIITGVNDTLHSWLGKISGKIKSTIKDFRFGNAQNETKTTGGTSNTVEVTVRRGNMQGGFGVIITDQESNRKNLGECLNWSEESFFYAENEHPEVKSVLEEDDMEEFPAQKKNYPEMKKKKKKNESNFSMQSRGVLTKVTTKANKIPFYEILKCQPKHFCQNIIPKKAEMAINKQKKVEEYRTTLAINLNTSSEGEFFSEPKLIIKNSLSDLVLYIQLDLEEAEVNQVKNTIDIKADINKKDTRQISECDQRKSKKLKVNQKEMEKLIRSEVIERKSVDSERIIEDGLKYIKEKKRKEEKEKKIKGKDEEKEKRVNLKCKEKEKKKEKEKESEKKKEKEKEKEKEREKESEKKNNTDLEDEEEKKRNELKGKEKENENENKLEMENKEEEKINEMKRKEKKMEPNVEDKVKNKIDLESEKEEKKVYVQDEEGIKDSTTVENWADRVEKERNKNTVFVEDEPSQLQEKSSDKLNTQEKIWETLTEFVMMANKLQAEIHVLQTESLEVYREDWKAVVENTEDCQQEVFPIDNEELKTALELIHKIENDVVSVNLSNAVFILPQLELELRKHLQEKIKAINSKHTCTESSVDSFFSATQFLATEEEEIEKNEENEEKEEKEEEEEKEESKTTEDKVKKIESSEERLKNLLKLLTNLEEAVKSNAQFADKIELCDHNSSKIYQLLHALTASIQGLENTNSIANLEDTLNIASQLDTEVRKYDSIIRKLPADYVGIEISSAEDEIKQSEKVHNEKDELSIKTHLKNVRKKVFEMVKKEALNIERKMEKNFDRIDCLEKENDETLKFIEAFLEKSEQRVIEQSNIKKELKQLSEVLNNIYEEMAKAVEEKKISQVAKQQPTNESQSEIKSVLKPSESVKDTISSLILALDKLKTRAKKKKEVCKEILGGIEMRSLSRKSSRSSKSSFTTTAGEDLVSSLKDFRIIGQGSLYLSWTQPEGPLKDFIGGYEILVDGKLNHKVRNPNRLQAVLYSVNLIDGTKVQLYAVIQNGPKILLVESTYQKSIQVQE